MDYLPDHSTQIEPKETEKEISPISDIDIQSQLRTQAFARVSGPYITIFTAVVALTDLTGLINDMFGNAAMGWMVGALMIAGGSEQVWGEQILSPFF